MKRMKSLNESSWKDMVEIHVTFRSRSVFKTYTKCDMQVNNICKVFNKKILDHRDKSISTLLEGGQTLYNKEDN